MSTYIREQPILWVNLDDEPSADSDRAYLDQNTIALLSNFDKQPIDPRGGGWLGRYSQSQAIRESGLWNVNHVGEEYEIEFLNLLERAVNDTTPLYRLGSQYLLTHPHCGVRKLCRGMKDNRMYWDDDELDEVVRYPTEGSAEELGSPIKFIAQGEIERGNVSEEIRGEFIENGFDYAPIRPYNSRRYYNVSTQEVRELEQEQYIGHDETMLKCLNVLTEYPLAIVTHPDRDCYGIVTPSNFNKRIAKEYLYTFFAATAQSISHVIESRYNTEEVLPTYLSNRDNGEAANRWAEARENNVELHVAEFMNLTDLKVILTEVEELREDMGFDSKTQCRKSFDAVSKFRDKVMHANRTMVSEADDIDALAEAIDEASSLTKQAQNLSS